MAKRRRQTPKALEDINDGLLREPRELVRACKNAIVRVLEDQDIGFDEYTAPRNRLIYRCTSWRATRALAQRQYSVLPFLEFSTGKYWLAISLELEFYKGFYRLLSASILVFRGDAGDERKDPILRAEWASPQEDASTAHAQPHWHIYPSRISREFTEGRAEFGVAADIQPFFAEEREIDIDSEDLLEWDRGDKFHFAMASRWHVDGNNAHQEVLQVSCISRWLEGCISYIRDQLQFLYR